MDGHAMVMDNITDNAVKERICIYVDKTMAVIHLFIVSPCNIAVKAIS